MTLTNTLTTLETSGLIRLAQMEPELEYLFRHALIQNAAYESILKTDRRILHRAIGETLERLYPERLSELAPILGQHFAEAGENEAAAKYLLLAGDRAREIYAYREAINHYERALPFLKEPGQAARTLMKVGLLYHALFDFHLSHQAYEKGFTLWQQVGENQPERPLPPAPHALRLAELPPTLDPALAADWTSIRIMDQLFSGLFELTPEMDVVPAVARTWDVLDGGRKYIFHLRDDVRWSDGTPVTARDFEYAWKRVLNPLTRSPLAHILYDLKGARAFHRGGASTAAELGVQAPDPFTLMVELEGPTSYFLHLLASNLYPVPRHVAEAQGADWTQAGTMVTNGPFRLDAWQPGQFLALSRNPDYYGQFGGNIQRVEVSLLDEFSAELERYEANHLDVSAILGLTAEMEGVQQRHPGEFLSAPGMDTVFVGFDLSRPPFSDARVRRSFALAVNRETLAEVILRGLYSPALGGFVPPGLPGHSARMGLPYEPDQARRLLAEGGYPEGRGFPVVKALAPQASKPMIEYLSTQWRENLGIEVAWETPEWATFNDQLETTLPAMFLTRWEGDYPDPDAFLRLAVSRYYTRSWSETYERLVESARRIADQHERMKIYQAVDQLLIEQAAVISLLYGRQLLLVKPWVSRYPISANKVLFAKDVVIEPH